MRKIIYPVAISVALVVAGVGFLVYRSKHMSTASQSSDTATVAEQRAANAVDSQNKQTFIENDSDKNGQNNLPANQENPAIELRAEQVGKESVTVYTKLKDIPNGTCSLKTTNDVSSVNQSAVVIYQPEYSTCAGFSVPIDKLGNGTWSITLTVDSSGKQYTKTITLSVT